MALAFVGFAAVGAANADNVLPGLDYWETTDPTWLDFSQSPIPADFFGPGSDPFDGVIYFAGEPIDPGTSGDSSTIVERLNTAVLPAIPSYATVDVEIIALQLVSVEPIAVSFWGGMETHFYEVFVDLNPDVASTGQMDIHHETPEGGVYDNISIMIYPRINFVPLGPMMPLEYRPTDPYELLSEDMYGWQHVSPYASPYPGQGPNFFPLDHMDLRLQGWDTVIGGSGGHGNDPRREITGCCFPDGSCQNMDVIACVGSGGTPMGQSCQGMMPCCLPDGSCAQMDALCCEFDQNGVPVAAAGCANSIEACCESSIPPYGCKDADAMCCAVVDGGEAQGPGSFCEGDTSPANGTDDACEGGGVPDVPQACCRPDGVCVFVNHTDCVTLGGDPQGPGTTCLDVTCRDLKWSQPPTYNPASPHPECFWGWDERSHYAGDVIIADDWLCTDEQPITDIHWWGSYIGSSDIDPPQCAPTGFHIGIWTDVPADMTHPWSHPGTMLHEWAVNIAELNERSVACDFHPDFMSDVDGCFRYDFIIPPDVGMGWFYQGPASTIYWISIAPIYMCTPSYPWGWKTREHYYNDDAVRIFWPTDPFPGSDCIEHYPIEDLSGMTWDMAFVLTTEEVETGACCRGDGTCDVMTAAACAGQGIYLSDGSTCGSMQACCYGTSCTDVDNVCCASPLAWGGTPGGSDTNCIGSLQGCCDGDGDCIELETVCCSAYGHTPQGPGEHCTTPEVCCLDATYPNDCIEVDPICCDDVGGGPSPTGALTCAGDDNQNGTNDACDDATQPDVACCLVDGTCIDTTHSDCVALGGDPQPFPELCGTGVVCTPLKWAQPPTYNPASSHPECFWGWDAQSIYAPWGPIAADDWLCSDERPVTDIHWWGSYGHDTEGWDGTEAPPDAPAEFHIGIWTDQPAVGEEPSRPDTMIQEWIVPRTALNERTAGCDFADGMMTVPDSCFRYDFIIPEGDEFYQGPASTVYWLSIAALYSNYCFCNGDVDGVNGVDIMDQLWVELCATGDCSMCTNSCDVNCDGTVDSLDVTAVNCLWTGGQDCCPGTISEIVYPWGWKAREPYYNDASYWIFDPLDPTEGSTWVDGHPMYGGGWDLAFVLTSSGPGLGDPDIPPPPHDVRKNRYISINPNNPSANVALEVTLTGMQRCAGHLGSTCVADADCPTVCSTDPTQVCTTDAQCAPGVCNVPTAPCTTHPHVGLTKWVDAPWDGSCFFEDGTPNGNPCTGEYVARLVNAPVVRVWPETPLHIGDCEIVPVATYRVRATDLVQYSTPLSVETIIKPGVWHYGDTVGTGTGMPTPFAFTAPQQVVNVTDVNAYLNTAFGPPKGGTHPTWVDLHGLGLCSLSFTPCTATPDCPPGETCMTGCPPNFILNVADLQRILFGLAGDTFTKAPDQLDPADCP